MKIVKVEAGWVVLGDAGAVLSTHATRERAREWVRLEKATPSPEQVKAFCAEFETALRNDGTIPADVVVNTTRPALPFAPSRYVGRTSLGLVLVSALPFDAFMNRPALGPLARGMSRFAN